MSATQTESAASGPVVFLGPTLPIAEAQKILPTARFAPPVRCGDVLALSRLSPLPAKLAIIDGCFEHIAAVWHKEILWALRRGCQVYGAASMGALRAAELDDLGMIGVGEIYADFRDGRLLDDAEVAVLHGPARLAYRPLTDALVNIRATLQLAETAGVIDEVAAQRLLSAAQAVFYQRRVFFDLLADLSMADPAAATLAKWLGQRGGLIDKKRQDAETLLKQLAAIDGSLLTAAEPMPIAPTSASDTIFLRSLQCYQACRPFPFFADWLPDDEKLGRAARLLGPRYVLIRQLALALALLDAGARQRGRTLEAALLRGPREALPSCQRLEQDLLRHFALYPLSPELAARFTPIVAPLASAWWALSEYLREAGDDVPIAPQRLLAFARRQQQMWGLYAQPELDAWRMRCDLKQDRDHLMFWLSAQRLHERLSPYALSHHGCFRVDSDRAWLIEALRLSGCHDELAQRLAQPTTRREFVSESRALWEKLGPTAESHALECDFESAAEVEGELARLSSAPNMVS